jgi:hypothetical protein
MPMLPSGLFDVVGDDEAITRFLNSSSFFSSVMVKPAAFLPNPKYRNTSVFRQITEPGRIRRVWSQVSIGDRTLHGAAILKAHDVRECELEVPSEEPPDRHADIVHWPSHSSDPELLKAKHKFLANELARRSTLLKL